MNLPVLTATTENEKPVKLRSLNPAAIKFNDSTYAVAFIVSDGDNVQWLMGDFCRNEYYWASRDHGKFPVGWGLPYACLQQASPETLAFLSTTQPSQTSMILHAGGYYVPDLVATNFLNQSVCRFFLHMQNA